jgi:hypothetical protein
MISTEANCQNSQMPTQLLLYLMSVSAFIKTTDYGLIFQQLGWIYLLLKHLSSSSSSSYV